MTTANSACTFPITLAPDLQFSLLFATRQTLLLLTALNAQIRLQHLIIRPALYLLVLMSDSMVLYCLGHRMQC